VGKGDQSDDKVGIELGHEFTERRMKDWMKLLGAEIGAGKNGLVGGWVAGAWGGHSGLEGGMGDMTQTRSGLRE
jgi:hypothetical protein